MRLLRLGLGCTTLFSNLRFTELTGSEGPRVKLRSRSPACSHRCEEAAQCDRLQKRESEKPQVYKTGNSRSESWVPRSTAAGRRQVA